MKTFSQILAIALLSILFSSCSENGKPEMDEWESKLAMELRATNVQLSHVSSSSTINGQPSSSSVYLKLEILNSETLDQLGGNERKLDKKYSEIRDLVVAYSNAIEVPAFNDLQIISTRKRGALIFSTTTTKTKTFRIH